MPDSVSSTIRRLREALSCDVRDDALARTLYAADASIYEIFPDAVAWPKTPEDVASAVRLCAANGLPVTARGAGTGLAGGAVNRGLILDCARHFTRTWDFDADRRTIWAQPGVVLDELNADLAPHGLHFAPDVATSNRATIGGMIANNSCGARSLVLGRTVDYVLALDVVLADGSRVVLGDGDGLAGVPLAAAGCETLRRVAGGLANEIRERYPRVARHNAGYALDRVKADAPDGNIVKFLCGSEGTLAVVVGAKLQLTPLPRYKGLVTICFDDMLAALGAVGDLLKHQPAAIELIDQLIVDAALHNTNLSRQCAFIVGRPEAVLVVEFVGDDEEQIRRKLEALAADVKARSIGRDPHVVTDAREQLGVWSVRKAGLGLLMSRPGDAQPLPFVEDTAVAPQKLRDYVARFQAILREEGVAQAGIYGHASVGCLHIRPVLNLKQGADVQRLRSIAQRVSSLALEFGGTMTGEHGDGIARSAWIEKIYGPEIVAGFREIKRAFDPQNVLNPGKIVDPLQMDDNLRYDPKFESQSPPTVLDFDAHGGMAGLAGMCSGVGECRKRLVGSMCPSYMATGDETHSTRARANALRAALSNRGLLKGLADPVLDDVFDLCLSCKACKTECPTGTDVARLKAEWLHAKNQREGTPRRSRLIADSIRLAAWGCRFAPISNWVMQNRVTRAFMEHWVGLDRRVPPPVFARQTFREWFSRRPRPESSAPPRERVVYFVDTWTNYYTPQVGQATVKVLEALGCEVLAPLAACCGRPLISKGLLNEAKQLAEDNVDVLGPLAEQGLPIIGTEPSCVSVLKDELPQFVRTPAARRIAEVASDIETFVSKRLAENPDALRFKAGVPRVLYHGHCHQKALTGTDGGLRVLNACTCGQAAEIDSGCCGMAGAFGHEVEHYDVAKAVGEQRLFPAVRGRGDAEIAISGFSCRHHITHHTGVKPRHVVEWLADALE